ncbi:MAG: hypothetical protein H6R18_2976 [Proteobacteria bacterium]|nr:hypothetical protein [Pseudomonadota bacterium]
MAVMHGTVKLLPHFARNQRTCHFRRLNLTRKAALGEFAHAPVLAASRHFHSKTPLNTAVDSEKQAKMTAFAQPATPMDCRPYCGACCIAPSISSLNKPAGEACRHLDAELRCAIFGQPQRPACCGGLQPSPEMCGESRAQALHWLANLEAATRPG